MNEKPERGIQHVGAAISQQLPARQASDAWTAEQMDVITNLIAKDCSPVELALFGEVCKKTGLDPFSKQIYAIKRRSHGEYRMTIQTSIDGFRAIAEDSGEYAGSDDVIYDGRFTLAEHIEKTGNAKTPPVTATSTVYRIVQGTRCAFAASAAYDQYAVRSQPGKSPTLWEILPHTMIAKCAEALALRKAFPRKLGGLYTGDEMGQAVEQSPTAPESPADKPAQALPAADEQRRPAYPPAKQRPADAPQLASDAMLTLIGNLMASHHVSPSQRDNIAAKMDVAGGMLKLDATKAINWLKKRIADGNVAEKQIADADRVVRDPDDDGPPDDYVPEFDDDDHADIEESLKQAGI